MAKFVKHSGQLRRLSTACLQLNFSHIFVVALLISLVVATAEQTINDSDDPSEGREDVGTSGGASSERIPAGGVPVPSIFKVLLESVGSPAFSSSNPPSTHGSRRPSDTSPTRPYANSWVGGGGGGIMMTELLEVNAFSRIGASFGNVLVLTDVDDTLWCSGSMSAFGKHIGGIDSELERGLPYPGIGTLLFFLALGPHTSTPRGLRIPLDHCPVPLLSPQTHNCPIDLHEVPVVPRSPGILTARVSTSVISSITRPPSFYADIHSILTSGARHVYGANMPSWPLGYENQVRAMHALGSQHSRGAAKVWGFSEAVKQGARAVVLGDTGEKDPEATAGIAVKHPDSIAAVFLHSVFLSREQEVEAAGDPTQNELPPHAIPLILNAGGSQVPALQLVYEVVAGVKEGEKVESFSDLSDETAYAAGVQIAADVRQIFSIATRKQLAAQHARSQDARTTFRPFPPAVVFVHVANLQTSVVETVQGAGAASQIANMSSKIAMRVSKWSAKRFSGNPELMDWAAFQQQAQVQPILLQAPQQGITSQGVRYPLGVPFASYRSTVGAGLASWALGMMPVQDLVSLVVASVRDFRSLGPPTHCWQRPVVQQLLFDILSLEHHVGQLETRYDLQGTAVYTDAVAALRAFESFHQAHCNRRENTPSPLQECLEKLEGAIVSHVGNGEKGSVQQLLPVLSLACRYREQLDHWLSAGSDEVESLTFILGRALILGMSAASLSNTRRTRDLRDRQAALRAKQENQHETLEQQQQRTNGSGKAEAQDVWRLQRDMVLLPELAVDQHVLPEEPPTALSPTLQMNALDVQTSEDLKPFMSEEYASSPPNITESNGRYFQENVAGPSVTNGSGTGGYRFGQLDGNTYTAAGPMSTLAANLRSFCRNSASAIATEVCNRLRRWLNEVKGLTGPDGKRSKGALPSLVKVAEWNANKTRTPLQLSSLGIILEPGHLRPGLTGRGEMEKAHVLNVVGGVASGSETVRHQRPTERAAWKRISWVLSTLTEMGFDLFGTQ